MGHTKDLKILKTIPNEFFSVNLDLRVIMRRISLIGYMEEKKQTIIEYFFMSVVLLSKIHFIVIVKNFEI